MHALGFEPRDSGVVDPAWQQAVTILRREVSGTDLERAVAVASRQGLVLLRSQARECGLDEATIRRLIRRGRWSVPRRGVLCPLAPGDDDERTPHGLAVPVRATAAALVRPGTIVSHDSAAAAHGLPLLWRVRRPTLTIVDDHRMVSRGDAVVRSVGLSPFDVTTWFGAMITTVDRTVIDIARNYGVAAGLVAADGALAAGLVTGTELADARVRSHHRPGVRTCDRVLELAQPLAESPLESLTRLCLIDGGLPAPELQAWVDTRRGSYRVDMLYADARVIVEADGELKYDGKRPDALRDEKRRQEALEQAGYIVVRVSWWEVRNEPSEVVARVRRALARAKR